MGNWEIENSISNQSCVQLSCLVDILLTREVKNAFQAPSALICIRTLIYFTRNLLAALNMHYTLLIQQSSFIFRV